MEIYLKWQLLPQYKKPPLPPWKIQKGFRKKKKERWRHEWTTNLANQNVMRLGNWAKRASWQRWYCLDMLYKRIYDWRPK